MMLIGQAPGVPLTLLILTCVVVMVTGECPCPIEDPVVCNLCSCELTPENKMAVICKGKGLTQVPTFIYTTTAFHEVTLADNQITNIPAEKFKELHSLTHLDLRGNVVTSIDNSAFSGIGDTLQELLLEVNLMTQFPTDALSGLGNLLYLAASGFDLSSTGLPSGALANLNQLERLLLSNNKLQSLSDNALSGQVDALKELILDGNKFTSIPTSALVLLQAMDTLSMVSNTPLKSITNNAFLGTNLRLIDLSQNGLTTINTGAFSGLEGILEALEMRSCQIQDHMLTPIQGLTTLKHLDLSINNIANIPSDLFSGMSRLTVLKLHQGSLHTISDSTFSGLGALQELDLGNNSLASVHANSFSATPQLKELTLVSNPNLAPALPSGVFQPVSSTLEILDLGGTAFTENHWDQIAELRQLTTLRLPNNHISQLHDMGMEKLTGLVNVYLGHNSLTQVTQEAIHGPNANLQLINFNTNGLTTLDQCVFFLFEAMYYYDLGLNENPLHCDCRLSWLLQELMKHEDYDYLKNGVGWRCATPASLSGRKFAELDESELVCDPPVTFAPCNDLTPTTTTTTTTTTTISKSPAPFTFNLNITEITDISIALYWTISEGVSDDLLGFRVQYRTMPEGGYMFVELNDDIRTHILTDLKTATEYLICVIAIGIQQTGNTVCDNAVTLPDSGEVSGAKDSTMIIALGCTLGALVVIAIIVIVVLVKRKQRKKAKAFADSLGVRIGADSKRFSRISRDTIDLDNIGNTELERKLEGFSRDEQNRILGLVSQHGASTLSMLSNASNPRYVQDLPYPPVGGRGGDLPIPPPDFQKNGYLNPLEVKDDPDKHVYCEIPAEGAYSLIPDSYI